MEAPNRDQTEEQLAAAILILWVICESVPLTTLAGWTVFSSAFNEKIRPILTQLYGTARVTIANQFGHQHTLVTDSQSGNVTVQIPNLRHSIDQYARDLYAIFLRRQVEDRRKEWEAKRQAEQDPEAPPVVVPRFSTSDADCIAVTTITEVQTKGEMDGAKDVESRVGHRVVGTWRAEPGACKFCRPLDGTTKEWRLVYPLGPPAHPNCRCHLDWRLFLD